MEKLWIDPCACLVGGIYYRPQRPKPSSLLRSFPAKLFPDRILADVCLLSLALGPRIITMAAMCAQHSCQRPNQPAYFHVLGGGGGGIPPLPLLVKCEVEYVQLYSRSKLCYFECLYWKKSKAILLVLMTMHAAAQPY
jgi:hypothetical protein